MAVSLKLVLSVFVCVAILATTLTAFLPIYLTGIESTEDAVGNVRDGIIDLSVANVGSLFSRGRDTIFAMQRSSKHLTDFDSLYVSDKDAIVQYLYGVAAASNGTLNNVYIASLANWSLVIDPRYGIDVPLLIQRPNASWIFVDAYARVGDRIVPVQRTLNVPFTIPVIAASRGALLAPLWLDPFYNDGDVILGFAVQLLSGSTVKGVFGISLIPKSLDGFLRGIGLREGGRAMVVSLWGTNNRTVLANSWNESNVVVHDPAVFSAGAMKSPNDYTDPLMRRVLSTYGEERLFNGAAPMSDKMGSGESDETYVDVIAVRDDFGLHTRIIIAMPLVDFLNDFYSSRTITIVVLTLAVVTILAASIAFSVLVSRPLDRLGERMYLTASLQDAGEDDAVSKLNEIAAMQKAYTSMKAELLRMKSYLPQSVLLCDDDDDDDEGEMEKLSHSSSKRPTPVNGSERGSSASSHALETTSNSSTNSKKYGAVGAGGLNTKSIVLQKRVAVAVFNLVGFHRRAEDKTTALRLQTSYLEAVQRAVRDNKGFIDFFQGDRITASFNAVSNVAAYTRRAVQCALQASAHYQAADSDAPPMAVGASAGTAIVGNVGTTELRRFNIISKAYTRAATLASLATSQLKSLAASTPPFEQFAIRRILADTAVVQDVELEFFVEGCDLLPPTNDTDVGYAGVYSIVRPKSVADDEWMYQIKEGEDTDPYKDVNQAFMHFLGVGVDDELKKLVDSLPADSMGAKALRQVVSQSPPS